MTQTTHSGPHPAGFGLTDHQGLLEDCPIAECEAQARQHRAQERRQATRAATVDLPIPIVVTRHQCPHCRATRSKKTAAIAHIGRCWKNPAVRSCKTCQHHLPPYSGDTCNPGKWCGCSEYPEACDVRAVPEGSDFPIVGCPQWEPREENWAC
jgi:hypothetical protein